MNEYNRIAEFAGRFYPTSKNEIENLLKRILRSELNKIDIQLAEKKKLQEL